VPDPCLTREQEHGDQPLGDGAQRVGGQHHALTRQSVGDDTAEQKKDDTGGEGDRQDEPECGDGGGPPDDGEGERDGGEAGAERRRGLAEPEESKLTLFEGSESLSDEHRAEAFDAPLTAR
jgi:hypothetical protein